MEAQNSSKIFFVSQKKHENFQHIAYCVMKHNINLCIIIETKPLVLYCDETPACAPGGGVFSRLYFTSRDKVLARYHCISNFPATAIVFKENFQCPVLLCTAKSADLGVRAQNMCSVAITESNRTKDLHP